MKFLTGDLLPDSAIANSQALFWPLFLFSFSYHVDVIHWTMDPLFLLGSTAHFWAFL